LERHDLWQWASIAALWFCHNLNAVLAAILTVMNIVWVGARLWDWFKKKKVKAVK